MDEASEEVVELDRVADSPFPRGGEPRTKASSEWVNFPSFLDVFRGMRVTGVARYTQSAQLESAEVARKPLDR